MSKFYKQASIMIQTKEDIYESKRNAILERIRVHYGAKLKREISDEEAEEIAGNLLGFAKALYGN